MVSSVNTSGISVGADGKINISGISSGIDSKAIIDSIIAAKRIPATKLESKITANNTLTQAYGDLKTKVAALTSALDQLRGNNSFGANNVFNTKAVSGSTAAAAGAPVGFTPSDIASLITVSVANTAQVADHTITIQQLAKADQFRSDSFANTNAALTTLGVTAGDISLNGKTITIDSDDTLLDLRSKINSAGAGVTATIVNSDATHNYLVVTSSTSGGANAVAFAGGSATSDSLGLTVAGAEKNNLQLARDAIIDVDGITDIHRDTNQINDVIDGVTLSLLKGEANTVINLKVEPDLVSIKGAVSSFVTAYNDLRDFYTDQRTAKDRNADGKIDDNELGPLAYDSTLRSVIDRLGQISATSINGNTDGYKSLSQVGVVVDSTYKLQLDDTIFDGKLLTNVDAFESLFAFGFSSNDSRVSYLARTPDTQAGTYYVNIGGTDGSGNLLSANIKATAGTGTGGANDGSATLLAKQLTGTGTGTAGAKGLGIYFGGANGLGPVNDIAVTVTRGIADSFYDFFNQLSQASGGLDTQVTDINDTNTKYQDQIDTIDTRLDTLRNTLQAKYTAMETALSQLNSLKDTLTSYFSAQSSSNNG